MSRKQLIELLLQHANKFKANQPCLVINATQNAFGDFATYVYPGDIREAFKDDIVVGEAGTIVELFLGKP